jgi:REP element-mobilizing transposase RayT
MPQSYAALYVHIIFSTKSRRRVISPDLTDRLYAFIGGILRKQKAKLVAAGGIPDHVHLLVSLGREASIATTVREIKTGSSRWMHCSIESQGKFQWQDGYSAFSVGRSELDRIRDYLANQEEHHRTMTYLEEVQMLLDRYGIKYDKRWLLKD